MKKDIPSRVIDFKLNSLLRETLNKHKSIESPALCLFPSSNIYTKPPRLVFRFKDGTKEDYDLIEEAIDNFEGNLDWVINRAEESKKGNHIIEPRIAFEKRNGSRPEPIKVWDLSELMEVCDKTVDDIRPLTSQIAQKLGIKSV